MKVFVAFSEVRHGDIYLNLRYSRFIRGQRGGLVLNEFSQFNKLVKDISFVHFEEFFMPVYYCYKNAGMIIMLCY